MCVCVCVCLYIYMRVCVHQKGSYSSKIAWWKMNVPSFLFLSLSNFAFHYPPLDAPCDMTRGVVFCVVDSPRCLSESGSESSEGTDSETEGASGSSCPTVSGGGGASSSSGLQADALEAMGQGILFLDQVLCSSHDFPSLLFFVSLPLVCASHDIWWCEDRRMTREMWSTNGSWWTQSLKGLRI